MSETAQGPDTWKARDLDNRTVTFQTDHTPQDRIAVRFEWALPFGELLKNRKNKMAMGSICQVMDRAQNCGDGGRKWAQNGRQGLSRKPRGPVRLKTWFGDGPRAWRGRQRPDPAKSGVPPASSIVGSAAWRSHSIINGQTFNISS